MPDQAVFTLINSDHWHASAYFRETELAHIKPGTAPRYMSWPIASVRFRAEWRALAGDQLRGAV